MSHTLSMRMKEQNLPDILTVLWLEIVTLVTVCLFPPTPCNSLMSAKVRKKNGKSDDGV